MPDSQTTAPDLADHRRERRNRLIRRLALGGLGLLVLAGLGGALGVRSRTVTAAGAGGTRVEVTYPQVARPGLAVPFQVRVSRPDGFAGQVEIRLTRSWLESFDENGVLPTPAEESSDGDDVVWTFDAPDGTVLTLALDVRVEPGVQWRRSGTTTVTVGSERVDVHHTMLVFP